MPMIIATEYNEDRTPHAAIAIDPMDVADVEGGVWGRQTFSRIMLKSGAVHVVDVPATDVVKQVVHVDEHAAYVKQRAALGDRVEDEYAKRKSDMAVYGG